MKPVVYYFTRTGVSEKVANEIGKSKNAEIHKITDSKNWNGVFGFMKAGYYAYKKKSLPAAFRKPEANEQIILVMPLWANGFPPAVRTFIDEIGREKITLVVTSMGSKLIDREGFVKVIDVINKEEKTYEV